MMKLTTYLIPTVFGSRVAMEYRIITRKRDMRTKFCKKNEKYIIDTMELQAEKYCKKEIPIEKNLIGRQILNIK